MNDVPHIISLGAGVQSSTMALMAAAGEITPMPLCAIFADTQDEPKSVYVWLDWLEKQLPFPVHRVTAGKLSDKILKINVTADGRKFSTCSIPVHIKKANGELSKIPLRGCTRDFKIIPVMKKMRALAMVKRGQKTTAVCQWIGISLDEMVRMKEAREPWVKSRWPLIEQKLSRHDCLEWVKAHGFPKPPRSACVYCPFHSDNHWRSLIAEEPQEFAVAVDFEKRLQAATANVGTFKAVGLYLHGSCVPLGEVDFSTDIERGQQAWWEENFRDECEGMCGV